MRQYEYVLNRRRELASGVKIFWFIPCITATLPLPKQISRNLTFIFSIYFNVACFLYLPFPSWTSHSSSSPSVSHPCVSESEMASWRGKYSRLKQRSSILSNFRGSISPRLRGPTHLLCSMANKTTRNKFNILFLQVCLIEGWVIKLLLL
jgi:hypothetical protein